MTAVAAIVAPVFALVAIGAGARVWRLLDTARLRALTNLTFYLFISALLFGAVARAPKVQSLDLAPNYFAACLIVFGAGLLPARLAGLAPGPTAIAVVAAGMPTGANAFFLARRTGTLAAASAETVVVSTMLSVVTASVALSLLR